MYFSHKLILPILGVPILQGCITSAVIDEAVKHERDIIYSVKSAYQTPSSLVVCLHGVPAGSTRDSEINSSEQNYSYILPIYERQSDTIKKVSNTNVKYYSSSTGVPHMIIKRQRVRNGCEIDGVVRTVQITELYTHGDIAMQLENIPPPGVVAIYNQNKALSILAYVDTSEIACGRRIVIINAEGEITTNYALLAVMPLAVAADIILIAGVIYAAGHHSNGHLDLKIPVTGSSHQSNGGFRTADYTSADPCAR